MSETRIMKAEAADIPEIMQIIEDARQAMRADGNPTQWPQGRPSTDTIAADIASGNGYKCKVGDTIVAYFAFIEGPDPTYTEIIGGAWLRPELAYFVIHRVASRAGSHGIFKAIMQFSTARTNNLRIDTHCDNHIMRHCLAKNGFHYCGIIHIADGTERMAFQKITG